MKHAKIVRHITGFSTPIFGLQWNPPTLDISIAQDVITFLEDKRVLYNPIEMEDANHCVQSVQMIRQELTNSMKKLSKVDSPLGKQLRKMREAAKKFTDSIGNHAFPRFDKVIQTSILERELFKLRDKFGICIAEIAGAYGLDVEDDLAVIIPFNNPN